MRFIDANVFLYAVIKPKKPISPKIIERKRKAKKILLRIQGGEEVVTTVVHLSEVTNILEAKLGLTKAIEFLEELMFAENVHILPVTTEDYIKALIVAREKNVSVNDALAYIKMQEKNIKEIYTFDEHFNKLGVIVVNE